MMDEQKQLTLTVSEVATMLRLSKGACYEAIHTGQIPSLRFGRCIRVPRYSLEQLLRVQNTGSKAEVKTSER